MSVRRAILRDFVYVCSMILEKTKEIVRRAAVLMVDRDFAVEQKDGCANIVTSSDLAVQEFLCRELAALIPGCGFICEEGDLSGPRKPAEGDEDNQECVWVIDPIDGTCNYSRGCGDCAISVALKKGPEVVLGVVYSPSRGELYWAEKGRGAFCNGKPLRASKRPFEDAILCTAMSTYRKEFAAVCSDIIMDAYYQCNDLRRFGVASLELCFLAAGQFELYFEMRLQPWDYAAAMLILQEAGGTITNLEGKTPRFDGPDLVCAASGPENHARLLGIIRSHLKEIPYTD